MSRKKAIDNFCKECLYDPNDHGHGTWRQQIDACTAKTCPLYEYRPRSRSPLDTGVVECDVEAGNMNDLLLKDEV